MSETINRILIGVTVCILIFCIGRDIELEKQYTGDLRNRIVGARLQKDGQLPYFYKWHTGDGLRYYDPQNFDSLQVSNITASPFTHQLIYPIADMPQRSISRVWLIIEYILLLLTAVLGFSLVRNNPQRWAVSIITGIFVLTSGWKGHIAAGQYYILIPALCMLFFYFTYSWKLSFHFIAGIIAASLILIRPTIVLFFLPLLPVFFSWPLRNRLLFVSATLLPLLFALAGSHKIAVWNEYREALKEQVKSHQQLQPLTNPSNVADPHFGNWEGWSVAQIRTDALRHPFSFESEHGNLFVIARQAGIRLPVWSLFILPFLLLLFIALFFYKTKNNILIASPVPLAILGTCLYMLSDICSPFYRFQYNSVQWFFPLLLAAAFYKKQFMPVYMLIATGLLLNIVEIKSIGFEHTIGELLVLSGLLLLAFRSIITKIKATA